MKHARIQTGGVFVSAEPAIVHTVLGSCIAACLFDPVVRVGGMNHFLLPDGADDLGAPARYGIHAMELLINGILRRGGDRFRLQAKVFGASHVLPITGLKISVPERNATFIREFLATERIRMVAAQLGGNRPLEVNFQTDTGTVKVRAFGWGGRPDLARREQMFATSMVHNPPRSEVTLF